MFLRHLDRAGRGGHHDRHVVGPAIHCVQAPVGDLGGEDEDCHGLGLAEEQAAVAILGVPVVESGTVARVRSGRTASRHFFTRRRISLRGIPLFVMGVREVAADERLIIGIGVRR